MVAKRSFKLKCLILFEDYFFVLTVRALKLLFIDI